MIKATAGKMLPTTITGSLPRPSWYTENLGIKSFLDAMVISRFREQYVDALSVYLREQEVAGLDIVTDGDCRFDQDVGGQSWTSYPPHHMDGIRRDASASWRAPVPAASGFPRGHILHDYLEARVMPKIVGPVGRGEMQYAEIWKAAQRLTQQAGEVRHRHAGAGRVCRAGRALQGPARSRIMAISDAFNEELHDLADAGCPVIQMEEPQIHLLAARGYVDKVINPEFMLKVFNNTVKGLRAKTEVWCHTCWGNPSQQRMFAQGADLQARARAAEPGRCRRDHVRDEELGRDGSRGRGQADHREEDRDRRDRSPHAAGRIAGRSRRRWCAWR